MKAWESDTENIQGTSFPDLYARDEVTPGAKDGTRIRASLISDIMGFFQACLSGVAEVPSDSRETYDLSQILKAIQGHSGAPGELAWWPGPSIPSWVRLLPLDGTGILCASYPLLVANIYCGNANNPTAPAFYKCTTAAGTVRSTSGTYLKLPDARGRFLRAIDIFGGVDPEGVRLPGAIQSASLAAHSHSKLYVSATEYKIISRTLELGSTSIFGLGVTSGSSLLTGSTGTGIGTGTTDETRPANMAAQLCIRY